MEINFRIFNAQIKVLTSIMLCLFFLPNFSFASTNTSLTDCPVSGEFCTFSDLKSKNCKRGSMLMVSGHGIIRFCDLDEPIITYNANGKGYAICEFSGYELVRKSNN